MAKTINPPQLVALGKFWRSQGGVNLGVVGDTKHATKGTSYHLGRAQLLPTAYSIELSRDAKGLSEAASAIDLGRLNGKLANLRVFSKWLVARCMADPGVRKDIREIIYSPDGKKVQRYSGVDNKVHTGPGQGDDSHLTHTHISFYRDSETRDKVGLFEPFFAVAWGDDVPDDIRAIEPKPTKVAAAIREFGHSPGSAINMGDLEAAMNRAGHLFGSVINPSDVTALLKLAARH